MKIGTRVTLKSNSRKDGTVIKTSDGMETVKWDKTKEVADVPTENLRIMGFDPAYDSGYGVIRDGKEMWHTTTGRRTVA